VANAALVCPDLCRMTDGAYPVLAMWRLALPHDTAQTTSHLSTLCPFYLHYAYLSELCPFDTELASRTTVLTNPTLHCVTFTTDTATWDTKIANYPSKSSYTMPDPCTELTESTLFRLIRHHVASQWYTVQVR
jgi:hypothetical protein